jgi:hypothetical protein
MAVTAHPSRDVARRFDKVTGTSGNAEGHIRAEANHLVHREEKRLAGVRHIGERLFEANQHACLPEKMRERRFVLAEELRGQSDGSAEQARVV